MVLPLAGLIASQGIRVVGAQALRHVAAKEAFGLAESALAKRAMPFLNDVMTAGEHFVPGRETLDRVSGLLNKPGMLGRLMGKADILQDLAKDSLLDLTKSLAERAVPGLGEAISITSHIKQASETFTATQDVASFMSAIGKIDFKGLMQTALSIGSKYLTELANQLSEISQMAHVAPTPTPSPESTPGLSR